MSHPQSKKRKAEWEEADAQARAAAEARGEDYSRVKARNLTAFEHERIVKRKEAKSNPDTGFGGTRAEESRLGGTALLCLTDIGRKRTNHLQQEQRDSVLGNPFYG